MTCVDKQTIMALELISFGVFEKIQILTPILVFHLSADFEFKFVF